MHFRLFVHAIVMFTMILSLIGSIGTAIGGEIYEANVDKVRELFEKRQYADATSLLEKYQLLSEQDIQWEFAVHDCFNIFNNSKSEYKSLLDEWVQGTPNNWVPLLARATYYDGLGWRARGAKWAKDTSDMQFRGMAENFALATQDIKAAVQINPQVAYAYYILMKMNRSSGNQQIGNLLVKKALEITPGSYLIRRQYMQLLLPRWGGSHAVMEEFAQEAKSYVEKNRSLNSLSGMVYWDQALAAESEKNYERAIELYHRSLSYGETWNTLYDLASTYNVNNEYDKAIQTIDNAISRITKLPDRYILSAPDLSDAYSLRSRICMKQKNWEGALKDLDRIVEEGGWRSKEKDELSQWAGKQLMSEGHALIRTDYLQAIEKYTLSLRFRPENAETYCWRGIAYNRIGKPENAEADLRKAIKLNPRQFEAYKGLDDLLFKQNRLDEIIEFWSRFIELEPSNAYAFIERSGTFYHKKDFHSALRDASRACELGNIKACQRAEQIKKGI